MFRSFNPFKLNNPSLEEIFNSSSCVIDGKPDRDVNSGLLPIDKFLVLNDGGRFKLTRALHPPAENEFANEMDDKPDKLVIFGELYIANPDFKESRLDKKLRFEFILCSLLGAVAICSNIVRKTSDAQNFSSFRKIVGASLLFTFRSNISQPWMNSVKKHIYSS